MKIIKIHGCSGAGKTTAIRRLMEACEFEPIKNDKGKIEAYKLETHTDHPTYVLGSYENTCGGMDTVGTAQEVIELVDKYAELGNVFFEGLLQSTYYGKMGLHSQRYGDDYIYAFLDTPIELCLARVVARRMASGRNNKFNPQLTKDKHDTIASLQQKLLSTNHKVVTVTHTEPLARQLLELLK